MSIDQSNASGTAGNPEVTNADTVWQSFTCGTSGGLSLIRVYRDSFSSSGSITAYLTIYSGEGLGGSVLYGAYVSLSSGGGLKDFWLSEPEAITSGNVYTFALSSATASWYVRTGFQSPNGPYSGGKAGHTGTSFGNVYDLYFETYIDEFLIYVADTATGTDSPVADTGVIANRYIGDTGHASEAIYAPILAVTDTGGVDPLLGEVITAPLFPITDTGAATELISRPILDTGTGTDAITATVSLPTISDIGQGHETIVVTGNTPTPPNTAQTGGLDGKPVLRLLYGNNKRNPDKILDLAQSAPGNIRLNAGGFAPGSGELNELWSDDSITHDGTRKFGESRKNTQLSITYSLTADSQTGLFYFQTQINKFFLDAKRYALGRQGKKVWLEYRWSDDLNTLPTPSFGQLSHFYEVYSASTPKWPDTLHDQFDDLNQGLIAQIAMNLTCSPTPEGMEQQAASAMGAVSLHDKGVLVASGSSSKLHWSGYTSSGVTGQFAIAGWITLNAAWASGSKEVFNYYVNASNRIRLWYDVSNTRFVVTKIVGGTTYTLNGSSTSLSNGDDVHLCIVQDSTTLHLYVNGVSKGSVTATATMTDGGLIALGCAPSGTVDGEDVIIDGWRIFGQAITSTQAAQLYAAESPIKSADGQAGAPPFFWTADGDSILDNVDDTSRNNWGIIGGISGDLEAKTRLTVTWATTYARDFYLGMKAQDSTFTPSDYLWNEYSNLTNQVDANFSGGSYRSDTLSTQSQGMTAAKTGLDATLFYNRYLALTRLYASNDVTVNLLWRFGATSTNEDAYNNAGENTLSIDYGSWQLLPLGDVFLEGDRYNAPTGYALNAKLTLVSDISDVISWTGGGDFIFLLPWPYAVLKDTQDSWSTSTKPYTLSIEDGKAYTTDTGADFSYIGAPIRPHPGKYNYLFLMQVENSNNEFQTGDTATVTVYVTPRFQLPGGMVA